MLVIPPSYFPGDTFIGGGERYAREYARALSKLTPTTLGFFDREAGVQMDRKLEIRTFSVRHFRPGPAMPFTRETLRALRHYDVVHVMVFPMPLTEMLILLARLRGQRVVLTDVGGGAPCISTYLQRLSPRLDLNRAAHGLAHLSRYGGSFFKDWPHPHEILYGGADLDGFPESGQEPEGYALFVGRLLPHKGVLQLIQALTPGTPLRVVGRPADPAYLALLRNAAAGKRVEFIFDVDDAALRRQYAGASVVLQPSLPAKHGVADKAELLGLVTLEGMASARPVIVTATASLPELVVDGTTGFVVPPFDLAALRARVERLVGDAALVQHMGAAARLHVEENFTWDRVARRGLAFYEQLLRRRGRSGRRSAVWAARETKQRSLGA